MGIDRRQRLLQLRHCCHTAAPPALTTEGLRKLGITPGRQVVVGMPRFTEQGLHAVETVVEHDHHRLCTGEAHHTDFLHGELVGTITGHQHDPALGIGQGTPQCRRRRPADRAPEGLAFNRHPIRQAHGIELEQAGAGVGHQQIRGPQKPLQTPIETRRSRGLISITAQGKQGLRLHRALLSPLTRSGICGLATLDQPSQNLAEAHAGEHLITGLNPVGMKGNHPACIQMAAPETCVEVLHHQPTQIDQEVGLLDNPLQGSRRRPHAVVHPQEGGVPLAEQRLVHRRGGVGKPRGLKEGGKRVHQAEALEGDRWHHQRALRPGQALHHQIEHSLQLDGHTGVLIDHAHRCSLDRRTGDRHQRQIHRHREVSGPRILQSLVDHPLQLHHHVLGSEPGTHTTGGSRDCLEAVVARIAEGVVADQSLTHDAHAGGAHQVKHGDSLGHRTHHAIESTEFANAVGGANNPGTTATGIAIGGIGRIQLVGRWHPLQSRMHLHRVIEGKGVITRHPEHMADSEVRQPIQYVGHNRRRHQYRSETTALVWR